MAWVRTASSAEAVAWRPFEELQARLFAAVVDDVCHAVELVELGVGDARAGEFGGPRLQHGAHVEEVVHVPERHGKHLVAAPREGADEALQPKGRERLAHGGLAHFETSGELGLGEFSAGLQLAGEDLVAEQLVDALRERRVSAVLARRDGRPVHVAVTGVPCLANGGVHPDRIPCSTALAICRLSYRIRQYRVKSRYRGSAQTSPSQR